MKIFKNYVAKYTKKTKYYSADITVDLEYYTFYVFYAISKKPIRHILGIMYTDDKVFTIFEHADCDTYGRAIDSIIRKFKPVKVHIYN